jgi:hypothetical protein
MNYYLTLIAPFIVLIFTLYIFLRYRKVVLQSDKASKMMSPIYLLIGFLGICLSIFEVLIIFGIVK